MDASNRQTGRTSKQIEAAPQGAVFVWVTGDLGYPRRLAEQLGRDDLQFVAPLFLERGEFGGRDTVVCIDHAFWGGPYRPGIHRPFLEWLRAAGLLIE